LAVELIMFAMERYKMIVTRDALGTYIYKLVLIDRSFLRPVYLFKAQEMIPLKKLVQTYMQENQAKQRY